MIATGGDALGQVDGTTALAGDACSLYVADVNGIRKRDAQGNWSVFDSDDSGLFAVDTAANLYVLSYGGAVGGIEKRDASGNWSEIASRGSAVGQIEFGYLDYLPPSLGLDAAGDLYVADPWNNRVQEYTVSPGP